MADVTISGRAILYLRQSADRTGEELAVTRQREDGTKLAQLRGWTIVDTQADNDLSAAGKRKRPGFEAVLAAISSGAAQVVIAWDMSRLSRNRRDTLRLMEVGEKAGVVLAFVRGSDLDLSTPAGRLTADILSGVARHEIDQKSDRQKRAAAQALEAGKWVGGRRPFGYQADGVKIRPKEAKALRRAYDDVLVGVPLARIAKGLNDAGLPTPQRTRDGEVSWWIAQTLRPTLLNPRYAGLRARTIRPEHGRPTWEIVGKATWRPIVPEETWRAVVAVLTDPSRANTPGSSRALLTGLGLCGVCAATVHGGRTRYGARTYRCSEAMGHISRAAEPVDEYVAEVVIERLSRADARGLLESGRPDAAPMRTEAMTLRARLDELATEFADGELTAGQLSTATRRIRDRLAAVETALADAGQVNLLGPIIAAGNLRKTWKALDLDRRRAVVDALMIVRLLPPGRGVRTFRPETVRVEWRS